MNVQIKQTEIIFEGKIFQLPVYLAGSNVQSVSVGSSFACALLNGGSIYCWGYNNHGQLGNGGNPQGSSLQSMGSKMLPVNFGASHS